MGKTMTEMVADVRLDLFDTTTALLTDQIERAIERAVYDYSRVHPREKFHEVNLQFDVEDENATLTSLDVWYSLTYKPIKWNSVVVTNGSTTTFTEDTDYYIDYTNGRIKGISGGGISAGDTVVVDYTKDKLNIDLSAVTDLIKPVQVIYPKGTRPYTELSFEFFGEVLTVGSREADDQSELTEDKHVVIKYHMLHTAPTGSAAGTFPSYIDVSIELQAAAYILFGWATQIERQSITDLASVRTELSNTTAIHTLITTALGKVSTYATDADTALDAAIVAAAAASTALGNVSVTDIETDLTNAEAEAALGNTALDNVTTYLAGGSESTKALLAQIATDIASLRTAIGTALDAANSYLDDVDVTDLGQATVGAEGLLETGDGLINTVNVGDNVPELYAEYAGQRVNQATARTQAAIGFIQEASQRISNLRAYIEQAGQYALISDGFIKEASQRASIAAGYIEAASQRASVQDVNLEKAKQYISTAQAYVNEAEMRLGMCAAFVDEANSRSYQIDRYLGEADRYLAAVDQQRALAESIRSSAQDRRNEAWAVWQDVSVLDLNKSTSSYKQR